jgi:hypothetical protein
MPDDVLTGGRKMAGKASYRVGVALTAIPHVLFPIYIAAFLWAGLFLREQRLRVLLPLRAA